MDIGRKIASRLKDATFERIAATALANADANRPRIRASILELAGRAFGEGDAAIVIAAGPSLHRRQSLERLKQSGFRGTVVAVDGALGACLRARRRSPRRRHRRSARRAHRALVRRSHSHGALDRRLLPPPGDGPRARPRRDRRQPPSGRAGEPSRPAADGGHRHLGVAGRREPLRVGGHGPLLVEPDVRRLRPARQRVAAHPPRQRPAVSQRRRQRRHRRLGGDARAAGKRRIGLLGMDFSYPPGNTADRHAVLPGAARAPRRALRRGLHQPR